MNVLVHFVSFVCLTRKRSELHALLHALFYKRNRDRRRGGRDERRGLEKRQGQIQHADSWHKHSDNCVCGVVYAYSAKKKMSSEGGRNSINLQCRSGQVRSLPPRRPRTLILLHYH